MVPRTQKRPLGAGIAMTVLERAMPLVEEEAGVEEAELFKQRRPIDELKEQSKLEEDQDTCDEGLSLSQAFGENELESDPESQACSDDALATERQAWKLHDKLAGFAVDAKLRSKHWEVDDEDEDDFGALSDGSYASSRSLDIPGSTEVDSPESTEVECSSVASMDSMVDYFSPEETIIIFDWDDTICPTTALNEDHDLTVGCESMQALVKQAKLTLEKAREVAAEVVIVTNGTAGWVESSCENYLPGLRPILDMLEFASARSAWEPMGVTTPTGWKAAAFEEIIRRFYSRYWRQSWKNVIVIGDACYEHEALAQVASLAPQGPSKRCRAKSIRFASQPSVELLTLELQMLCESFDDIVLHDDNLEFSFQSESL